MTADVRKNRQSSEADTPPVGDPAVDQAGWVPETEIVHTRRISCDGGEGALGHPRVWMTIPETGPDAGHVDCGYCDKRFILADDAGGH